MQRHRLTLPIFSFDKDFSRVYEVSTKYRTPEDLARRYDIPVLQKGQVRIALRGEDLSEDLPSAYAEYGAYRVFLAESAMLTGVVARFRAFQELEERHAKIELFEKCTRSIEEVLKFFLRKK